jgi:hypothetical protein
MCSPGASPPSSTPGLLALDGTPAVAVYANFQIVAGRSWLCASLFNRESSRRDKWHCTNLGIRFMPLSANHKRAQTGSEVNPMAAVASIWKKKRDDLKKKRNALFETYSKDPQNFHLAREIKAIDDDIAECTQHVEQERRVEQRAAAAGKLVTTPK